MFNKKVLAGILSGISLCLFSGCLGDGGDNETVVTVSVASTLFVQESGDCLVTVDGGSTIMLTASSIERKLGKNGLNGVKRAIITCKYNLEDAALVDGETNRAYVSKAEFISYFPIPIKRVLKAGTLESDDEAIAMATKPDSINAISQINELYVYRGYLTVNYNASCYADIAPSLTMICDSVKPNETYFSLLYNNHASMNTTVNQYICSFSTMRPELYSYPEDSVNVHISAYVGSNKNYKIDLKASRQDLYPMEVN